MLVSLILTFSGCDYTLVETDTKTLSKLIGLVRKLDANLGVLVQVLLW